MIGSSSCMPIIVEPPNKLLGLAIAEGIEDALSWHAATGLGAWATGAASRLPRLAAAVPGYVDSICIVPDEDGAGWKHANELAMAREDESVHEARATILAVSILQVFEALAQRLEFRIAGMFPQAPVQLDRYLFGFLLGIGICEQSRSPLRQRR